jgi:O-antigen ligase
MAAYLLGPVAVLAAVAVPLAVGVVLDPRFALAMIVVNVTVLGSELHAGPVRVIDAIVPLGLLGLALGGEASRAAPGPRKSQAARAACWLLLATLVIGTLVAVARDNPFDNIGPELHNAAVPIGAFFIARAAIRRAGADWVLGVLVLAVLAAATKAVLLSVLSGGIANAPDSVWQAYAYTESLGTSRVILIGGDTFLAVGPAVLLLARRLPMLRSGRWVGAIAFVGIAVALSGTRTNIIVATLAVLLALGLVIAEAPAKRASLLGATAGLLLAVGLLVFATGFVSSGGQPIARGVTVRFVSSVLVQSSLRYRQDEERRISDALHGHELLGLGIGGTYFTQTSAYTWEQTTWAHNALLWIGLKAGVVGLGAFAGSLLLLVVGLWRRRGVALAQAALILALGTVALSVTTNRLTDVGGGLLLALAFACLSVRAESP